ncbi:SDR family oxidoreductase [Paraburkholderia acidisoli]|uniref:SDR family oxidoreductase n=1 Tax=Paraburkholderia acidisoli TaxID=2571748 RepID=A0A7Z2JIX0_9BURK|nr:SDR family oxidoreductase [Paraburkholderia acidisoli]QGZ65603.1 SDR family oxidoreductase [Paraburkholderia acidisoli]
MKIQDSVVFITGANRGIGAAFAKALLARGAKKVYAGARDPDSVTLPGVVPVRLDVTNDADVAAAAAQCQDVTLVINNAGIARYGAFLAEQAADLVREQLETNFFGVLRVSQAFAPVLAANGGGALVNVLSVASWINRSLLAGYGATKSAAWALTNGLRSELQEQGTQVLALHMGFVATDLTRDLDVPKQTPEAIVAAALDALEAGASEVMADEMTRKVKAGLSATPASYMALPQV